MDLANVDKSLIYRGEVVIVNDRPVLNGLGSLECRGYVQNGNALFSCFNGIFVDNVRQGYTSMTVTDQHGEMQWRYEGVYKQNQPNGQGSLTVPLSIINPETGKPQRTGEMQEFQGGFKQGLIEGFGQVTIEGKVSYSGQWRNGVPHGNGQATYHEL